MKCLAFRRFAQTLFVILLISMGYRTFGQDALPGIYRSPVDELLTIQKVSVLPFTDNLQGIYARPLEAHLISLVDGMHRWDYVPAANAGALFSPEELEESIDKTKQAGQGLNADGFFACRITKGPNGVTIHLSLFLTKDNKLLSQAVLKDYKIFNISDLKEQMQRLLNEIVARLPYAGRVLSRDGNRVTVNLGSKDGLQAGQMLSVIQIIQAQRHPKFNFLVKTEKEIFGKIKIVKVDETLSFGAIVTEKEKGAIQKNAKIGAIDFVTYPAGDGLSLNPSTEDALTQREDSGIAFGKDAKVWVPRKPPSIGQVGARLGLGRFTENMDLPGVQSLNGSNNFVPNIFLNGELWITSEFTFHADLRQAFWTVGNPRGGSPSNLGMSLSYYEAGFGYSFRFGPNVWSASVEPFLGYFDYKTFADSSDPQAFTTTEYSGLKLGVRGITPITADGLYGAGGVFSIAVRPALHESPITSGDSSSSNVIQFGIFGYKRLGERLKLKVDLDFDMYSSNFSGSGTRTDAAASSSQRITTLSAGVDYMF